MSYRVLSCSHPSYIHQDKLRLFCESVIIQINLKSIGYEIIYVDEFNISTHR